MANILLVNQPFVSVGLGTFTHTIASAGLYNVHVESTETPPTSLTMIVTQNGPTVYTAPVITPTQSAIQFKVPLVCTAADAITVVLSSGAAIDNQLNTLKTTVTIGQGQ